MNLRRKRAPATTPASCISHASQSQRRFPAVSHPHPTYATLYTNEACQSASHPNTKRCRHSPQLIYTSTIPSGLCIGFSYTDKHLSKLTLASPSTSLQDPTLLDQHEHKDKHTYSYPSSTADARRKTVSFRSLICKRHGSKHVLLRSICPVGFMPCHQRASSASDLLGR